MESAVAVLSERRGLATYVALFGGRRIGWFAGCLAVFLLTLLSPLNTLADGYLFSAHMVQHILLLLIVPALLLLSLSRRVSIGPRLAGHPFVGWAAGVGAMWFWHVPALCNAAVLSRRSCGTEFRCWCWAAFSGGRFCAALIGAPFAASRSILFVHRVRDVQRAGNYYHLLAGDGLFDLHAANPDRWECCRPPSKAGGGPERDQQIGGLLMWVPMCLVYLTAIFAQLARWFAEPREARKEKIS